MKKLSLVADTDPVLRKPCSKVSVFDDSIRQITSQMINLMFRNGGIGIAAPQVGISKSIMVVGDGHGPSIVMINPQMSVVTDEMEMGTEGCLSFPGLSLEVPRLRSVVVKYQDVRGQFRRLEASNLLARCVQHEIDHINGILFTDRAAVQQSN